MNIIVDTTGNVLMYSEDGKPTAGAGETLLTLTGEQADELRALTSTRNAGLRFSAGRLSALPAAPVVNSIDQRQAAIEALLAEQAKRADAPQAVKDYAESK